MIRRSTSWFAAFQMVLTAAVLAAVTAWLNGQPWMQNQIAAMFGPRVLQATASVLACSAPHGRRPGLPCGEFRRRVVSEERRQRRPPDILRTVRQQFCVGRLERLAGGDGGACHGRRAAAAQGSVAFGSFAWLLAATQAVALLIALWSRWRRQETVCGVLLIGTAAVLAVGPYAGSLAAASALRWSLSGTFLFGSALVWFRSSLEHGTGKTPLPL